nr:hypothetical protein CFP56_72054 [Quercus suber]
MIQQSRHLPDANLAPSSPRPFDSSAQWQVKRYISPNTASPRPSALISRSSFRMPMWTPRASLRPFVRGHAKEPRYKVLGEPLMSGFELQFERNYDCSTPTDLQKLVFLGHVDSNHLYRPSYGDFVKETIPRVRLEHEAARISPPPKGQNIRLPIDGVSIVHPLSFALSIDKHSSDQNQTLPGVDDGISSKPHRAEGLLRPLEVTSFSFPKIDLTSRSLEIIIITLSFLRTQDRHYVRKKRFHTADNNVSCIARSYKLCCTENKVPETLALHAQLQIPGWSASIRLNPRTSTE